MAVPCRIIDYGAVRHRGYACAKQDQGFPARHFVVRGLYDDDFWFYYWTGLHHLTKEAVRDDTVKRGASMTLNDLPELENVLATAIHKLNQVNIPWLLGGSCSLLLQDVKLDKPPRDIDLYTDAEGVHPLHESLASAAVDAPRLDQEGMYSSILSHYAINEVPIELVGGFKVNSSGSSYMVEIDSLLYRAAPENRIQDATVRLMPLSHELVFNVLRDRQDRYEAIAEAVRIDKDKHIPLLQQLLSRNRLSAEHLRVLNRLTGLQP